MPTLDIVTVSFPLSEAKARFSELVKLAEAGETVEITRHGKVVAQLTRAAPFRRKPGSAKGTVHWDPDSFEFTDDEIEELFHAPISEDRP